MDASQRSFIGALAAAIKAFCMLFINAVNVADNAVAMADKAVKVAREKQAVDLGINMNDYVTKAINTAKFAQVKAELAMREYIGNDPEKKALMDAAQTKLENIVKKELSAIEAEQSQN